MESERVYYLEIKYRLLVVAICLPSIFFYDKQILIITNFPFFFFAIFRWSEKMRVAQYESMHITTHFNAFPIDKKYLTKTRISKRNIKWCRLTFLVDKWHKWTVRTVFDHTNLSLDLCRTLHYKHIKYEKRKSLTWPCSLLQWDYYHI